MSDKTNEEIVAFLRDAPEQDTTTEEFASRLSAFLAGASDEAVIAGWLANRIILLEQPFGVVWAPPRFLPRLKRMARLLGARAEIKGSLWKFSMPGQVTEGIDWLEFGQPADKRDRITPCFVFERRTDVERETGFVLAGTLYIDIPKPKPKKIGGLLNNLVQMAKDGRLEGDASVIGWNGPKPPYGDEVTDDKEFMATWAADKTVCLVRVPDAGHVFDPSDMRKDSDVLRTMGLGRDGKPLQ